VSPGVDESVQEVDELPASKAVDEDERPQDRRRVLQESDVNVVRGASASPEKAGIHSSAAAGMRILKPNSPVMERRSKATENPQAAESAAERIVTKGTKRRRPSTERMDSASSVIEAPPPKRKRRKFADILAEIG